MWRIIDNDVKRLFRVHHQTKGGKTSQHTATPSFCILFLFHHQSCVAVMPCHVSNPFPICSRSSLWAMTERRMLFCLSFFCWHHCQAVTPHNSACSCTTPNGDSFSLASIHHLPITSLYCCPLMDDMECGGTHCSSTNQTAGWQKIAFVCNCLQQSQFTLVSPEHILAILCNHLQNFAMCCNHLQWSHISVPITHELVHLGIILVPGKMTIKQTSLVSSISNRAHISGQILLDSCQHCCTATQEGGGGQRSWSQFWLDVGRTVCHVLCD